MLCGTGTPAEVKTEKTAERERRLHLTSGSSEEEIRGTTKCEGERTCFPPTGTDLIG